MSTVRQLTRALEKSYADLRSAIARAEGYWDAAVLPPEAEEVNPRATGKPWTPQEAANHAIGTLGFFAHTAASGLGVDIASPEPPDVSSAASALKSLESSITTCHSTLEATTDQTLTNGTIIPDIALNYAATRGQAVEKNVEGAFQIAIVHSTDHAQQIAGGAKRT